MSRDIPAIDAIIAGFCSSHDEPNAAEQAIAFDQSLERSGWSIVRTDTIKQCRDALNEVTTNGQWTKGEQLGDWAISKEVYETARDAIGGQLRMEP